MEQPRCVAGVDVGTTSVKVVIFDEAGREISRATENIELLHADDGRAEQQPNDVYSTVTSTLCKAVKAAHAEGYVVDKVGFSAAMHSMIAIDKDGSALTNAITWMDTRAKAVSEELWATPEGPQVYSRTGTPIHPMSPLVKLIWLRRAHADVFAAAAKFVSLKEWIWFQWFGEWCVDASMASATGLYNLRENDWDSEALALAGIDASKLSTLVPTTYVKSAVYEPLLQQSGIAPQTRFNIGASDGVLANLGVGAIDRERMVFTVGTSCAVRLGSSVPVTDVATRSFCYVLDQELFVVGGPSNSGGIVLDWLHNQLLNSEHLHSIEGLSDAIIAAEEVQTDELFCLPYVTGERAPLWNADAKAAFIGLQLHHTSVHLMRSAIEGIVFNAFWIASGLFQQLGKPKQLIASGRLFENRWVLQLLADVFGLPVAYGDTVDASVVGATFLANIACGDATWQSQVGRLQVASKEIVTPKAHERLVKKFESYQRLCATIFNPLK